MKAHACGDEGENELCRLKELVPTPRPNNCFVDCLYALLFHVTHCFGHALGPSNATAINAPFFNISSSFINTTSSFTTIRQLLSTHNFQLFSFHT